MLVAIAGGINNIGNGQILIIVDKFLAFRVGKNWPAMIRAMVFPGHWLWDIPMGKAQSIGSNSCSSSAFLQAVAKIPVAIHRASDLQAIG